MDYSTRGDANSCRIRARSARVISGSKNRCNRMPVVSSRRLRAKLGDRMGERCGFAMVFGVVGFMWVGFAPPLLAQSGCLDVIEQQLACATDGSGDYVLSLTVTNAGPFVLEFGFHLGDPVLPVGVVFDPEVHEGIGLAPGGTAELTTVVSGLLPGEVICHLLTLHNATLDDCCVAAICLVVPSCDEETFVRGDCNADGGFDIGDAITLLSVLFSGAPSPPCDDACDCNDDGLLDIADAISKLGSLFSGSGPLPPPASSCGPDPTPDSLSCAVFPPCP